MRPRNGTDEIMGDGEDSERKQIHGQAATWSIAIACHGIKHERKEVAPEFALSSPHDALQELSTVGKACGVFIEPLCLQRDSELAIGSNSLFVPSELLHRTFARAVVLFPPPRSPL